MGTLVEKGVGKYEGDFIDNLFHGHGCVFGFLHIVRGR